MCSCVLTRGCVHGGSKLACKAYRNLYTELVVSRSLTKCAALEKHIASKVVGLSLKAIRDFRRKCLLAVLKQLEDLSMAGHLMVPSLMKLEKRLFGDADSMIDMDVIRPEFE